ncbi:MAG: restriction endonuclease subunit S [Chitinophagia bacterium]|nr:restriction endonuclease subunit S [Chitinophagia bacterium]
MKSKIQHIATLQTGLFAKPLAMGEVVYLQSKHFDEQGNLSANLHPDLSIEDISAKHLLRAGDVLFAAKGTKNFAAIYEEHNLPAVASTSFFVIRLLNSDVLPEYLAWFLNNPNTQASLKAQAMGTSIPSISKQVLEELEMPIPSIEKQISVVSISKLRLQEKAIQMKLESLRDKKIQTQINNAINH